MTERNMESRTIAEALGRDIDRLLWGIPAEQANSVSKEYEELLQTAQALLHSVPKPAPGAQSRIWRRVKEDIDSFNQLWLWRRLFLLLKASILGIERGSTRRWAPAGLALPLAAASLVSLAILMAWPSSRAEGRRLLDVAANTVFSLSTGTFESYAVQSPRTPVSGPQQPLVIDGKRIVAYTPHRTASGANIGEAAPPETVGGTPSLLAALARLSASAVGFALLFAGLAKTRNQAHFQEILARFGVPWVWARSFLSSALPVLEMSLGTALVLNLLPLWASLASLGLFVTFLIASVITLTRGQQIPCGCFGVSLDEYVGKGTVTRQVFYAGLCTVTVSALTLVGDPGGSRTLSELGPYNSVLLTAAGPGVFVADRLLAAWRSLDRHARGQGV